MGKRKTKTLKVESKKMEAYRALKLREKAIALMEISDISYDEAFEKISYERAQKEEKLALFINRPKQVRGRSRSRRSGKENILAKARRSGIKFNGKPLCGGGTGSGK